MGTPLSTLIRNREIRMFFRKFGLFCGYFYWAVGRWLLALILVDFPKIRSSPLPLVRSSFHSSLTRFWLLLTRSSLTSFARRSFVVVRTFARRSLRSLLAHSCLVVVVLEVGARWLGSLFSLTPRLRLVVRSAGLEGQVELLSPAPHGLCWWLFLGLSDWKIPNYKNGLLMAIWGCF